MVSLIEVWISRWSYLQCVAGKSPGNSSIWTAGYLIANDVAIRLRKTKKEFKSKEWRRLDPESQQIITNYNGMRDEVYLFNEMLKRVVDEVLRAKLLERSSLRDAYQASWRDRMKLIMRLEYASRNGKGGTRKTNKKIIKRKPAGSTTASSPW